MKRLYSLRDSAAVSFGPVFAFDNDALALRSLAHLLKNDSNAVSLHPRDYELFALAYFDEATGIVRALDAPESVARCIDLMKENGYAS